MESNKEIHNETAEDTAVTDFKISGLSMYDSRPHVQPNIFTNSEFSGLLEIMFSHTFTRTVDTSVSFGYVTHCKSCGEMTAGDSQEFHIAHQILLAGYGDKVALLKTLAQDVKDRGDVGKEDEGGIPVENYLLGKASIIRNNGHDSE